MKFRLVAALALISTVSLIAAACGGDDDDVPGVGVVGHCVLDQCTAPTAELKHDKMKG